METVRYRPAHRAVLKHQISWRRSHTPGLTLFARVMPPSHLDKYMGTLALAKKSGFCVPEPVGTWVEGGVIWTPEVLGETVRSSIRAGCPPPVEGLLGGLAQLWSSRAAPEATPGHTLDVLGGYQMSRDLLEHVVWDDGSRKQLESITNVLGDFAEAWIPTCLAHNDFHDDQLILTTEGQLALIDFEEVGSGDPLLDVGMLLAHLHWMADFSATPEAFRSYRDQIRSSALSNFGWNKQELDIREAFALFRLSSGPIRHLKGDWAKQVSSALDIVAELLASARS